MMTDWEDFRRPDGSINLYNAWAAAQKRGLSHEECSFATTYFDDIERRQKIGSRQAAAVAVETCDQLLELAQMIRGLTSLVAGRNS